MSSDTGLGIRTAQAVGIIGSAFVAGGVITISTIITPTLVVPLQQQQQQGGKNNYPLSTQIATQWLSLYNKGKKTFPFLAGTASVAYGYLAWSSLGGGGGVSNGGGGGNHQYCYYLGALGLTLGIVPYTLLAMIGVNKTIEGYATDTSSGKDFVGDEETEKKREAELEGLVKSWTALNLVRGLGPLVGSVLGLYAAVSV